MGHLSYQTYCYADNISVTIRFNLNKEVEVFATNFWLAKTGFQSAELTTLTRNSNSKSVSIVLTAKQLQLIKIRNSLGLQ